MDDDQRAQYVERWARALEDTGHPRIAGRIFGHLVTAPTPYLSLQELAEELGVSRASVSTNTRRLVDMNLISKVAVPGSRGEHYAADPSAASQLLQGVAHSLQVLAELSAEGVALVPDPSLPGARSLRFLSELYGRIGRAFEEALEHAGEHAR